MKHVSSVLGGALALLLLPGGVSAQGDPASASPPQVAADSSATGQDMTPPLETRLVFDREVFVYPPFGRRNPFAPLVGGIAGPRFEQIELRMIIHHEDPRARVALLGLRAAEAEAQAAEGRPGVNRTRRIRAGENWGNVRVLEIRETEILIEVEEFGLTEQRIMEMPTRAQGGS